MFCGISSTPGITRKKAGGREWRVLQTKWPCPVSKSWSQCLQNMFICLLYVRDPYFGTYQTNTALYILVLICTGPFAKLP